MKIARLLLLALLPLGCAPSRSGLPAASTPEAATQFVGPSAASAPAGAQPSGQARLVAHVSDEQLDELSGLAASRRFPGWAWAHNDSGDSARLFLLDNQGRTRAIVSIAGVEALDWEDIAVAGSKRDSTVTVADSGDNLHFRDEIVLHRFRERDLPLQVLERPRAPLAPIEVSISAQPLRLRYPESEGAQDAEALAANANGDLLIVTKSTGPSRFYLARWPQSKIAVGAQEPQAQTLKLVGEKQFGSSEPGKRHVRQMLVTAADLSPDESRLALATYVSLYVWNMPPGSWGQLDWKALLGSTPEMMALPELKQCESVAWMGASNVWVSSEGEGAPLWSIPVAPTK